MNVLILRRAEADLKRIEEHIEIDNPSAARTTIRRIRKRCLDLAGFSHQGRPAGGGRRGLVIAGTPYLAIYRIAIAQAKGALPIWHPLVWEPRR